MCIFFKTTHLVQQTEDEIVHVIVLKPNYNKLT